VHQPDETRAIYRGGERRTIFVALVAIGFVAVAIVKPWGGSVPTSAPSASPAVVAFGQASTVTPPTTPSEPTFVPDGVPVIGRLDAGTYTYGDVDRQGFNVRFTVPAGWTWHGRYLNKGGVGPPDGASIFFFGGPVQVYPDPCDWAELRNPPMALSAGDVIAALTAQPMRNATTPIDRPADVPGLANRWPGKTVELTVPDVNFAGCDEGEFRSWGPNNNVRSHQGPGQRDLVWAVDIPGAGVDNGQHAIIEPPPVGGLIIDAASFPGTPADVMSEVEAILRSIAAGHWG
jgi:hypothetical protein